MKTSQQIVVFDFDGVISNSIHESFMTALNAYIKFVPDHTLPLENPLESDTVFQFEKEHPEIFRQFFQLMPMGNRAEDYLLILLLIDRKENEKVTNQSEFEDFKKTLPIEIQEEFHRYFYQSRLSFRQQDPATWIEIHKPFPGIVDAVKSLSQRFFLAISTSKDLASVDILLQHYGLSRYFKPENILDKDFAKSKRLHITKFQKEHNIPFTNIHFIDDKVLHLVSVKDLGINCYLATWGFNTEREHKIAMKEGFTLLRLEDLEKLGYNQKPDWS